MPFKVNPLNFRRIPRCRLTNSPLAGLPIPPSRDGISPQSVLFMGRFPTSFKTLRGFKLSVRRSKHSPPSASHEASQPSR